MGVFDFVPTNVLICTCKILVNGSTVKQCGKQIKSWPEMNRVSIGPIFFFFFEQSLDFVMITMILLR